MVRVVGLLLPLFLLAFWAWMYWDLTNNVDLPNCYISFTGGSNPRLDWNIAFILLSGITADVYFVNVYRYRH